MCDRASAWLHPQVLHECDLALITCDEENSFEDITPMQLSDIDSIPNLREKVLAPGQIHTRKDIVSLAL